MNFGSIREVKLMNKELVTYLESSFLSPLLSDTEITDISYNGKDIYYLHNQFGRKKSNIEVSKDEVAVFIRQIANLAEKQFSYTNPSIDVSEGKYRINAIHQSIVRVENEKSISFSIRIASPNNRILTSKSFMNSKMKTFLLDCLKKQKSIVIGGPTGSGKTELQKYLLTSLEDNSRVIVIDNVQELEFIRSNPNLDITSWEANENHVNSSINDLIRQALRSNPDWLVVAESRGKEMNDVLTSVMTGHPIITTMHAKSLMSMPHRLVRMIEMADTRESYDDIMGDLLSHIPVYVFVRRDITKDGNVHRYIEAIGEVENKVLVEKFHC